MGHDDDVVRARSRRPARRAGELVWRLPLHAEYAELIKGRYADIVNAVENRKARRRSPPRSSCSRFVGDVPWAHLDIAGTAWDTGKAYAPKGGVGLRRAAARRARLPLAAFHPGNCRRGAARTALADSSSRTTARVAGAAAPTRSPRAAPSPRHRRSGRSTAADVALERAGASTSGPHAAHAAAPSCFANFKAIAAVGRRRVRRCRRASAPTLLIGYGDHVRQRRTARPRVRLQQRLHRLLPAAGRQRLRRGRCCSSTTSTRRRSSSTARTRPRPRRRSRRRVDARARRRSATRSSTSSAAARRASGRSSRPRSYNRRITRPTRPALAFTGPARRRPGLPGHRHGGRRLARRTARAASRPGAPRCRCEENYAGLRAALGRLRATAGYASGTTGYGRRRTTATGGRAPAKYGWVCEHDPYDPRFDSRRKHTALGRFRHENTAFRDRAGQAASCSTWATTAPTAASTSSSPTAPSIRRRTAEQPAGSSSQGTLYVAALGAGGAPHVRRRRRHEADHARPSGTGTWVRGARGRARRHATELRRAAVGATEYDAPLRHQPARRTSRSTPTARSTSRSTNNSTRQRRARLGPAAASRPATTRRRARSPGRTTQPAARPGRADAGEQGFSSPDNLVFDNGRQPLGRHGHLVQRALNKRRPVRVPRATTRCSWCRARGPNAGVGVPLRQHAGGGRGHRAVLHAGRVDAVPQRPAPRRDDRTSADAVYDGRETCTSCWPQRQPDSGPEPAPRRSPRSWQVTRVRAGRRRSPAPR